MPVRKFRSVEEMNQPLWRRPGEPVLYRAIAGLWNAGLRVHGARFAPGVYRFRTVGELEAAADSGHGLVSHRRARSE